MDWGGRVTSVVPRPPAESVARIEAGLIASWERLCGLLPDAAIYHHDGLVLALPGVGIPPINGVVPEPGVDPAHPAEAIEVLDGLCASHGARLLVDLAAGAHPGLEAALRQAGLRPGVRRRGMITTLDRQPVPPPEAMAVPAGARLRDAVGDDVVALRRLEQECFGLAPVVAERFLPPAALDDPEYRTVVAEPLGPAEPLGSPEPRERTAPGGGAGFARPAGARVRGAPDGGARSTPPLLAKAHGHLRHGALGITGVATTASARRRGLARALVVELLDGARGRGAAWSWLLSELPAAGVYLGVGFRDVAEWWLWSRP